MAFIGNTNITQAFTPAIDYFSGNASTTAFTLSRPVASVAQVQAVVNNVAQNPSDAFTVSSNTITFTSAPSSGTNNIYVYYTSPITQVIAPGQGTVTTASLDSAFVLPVVDGGTGVTSSTGSGSVVLATSPSFTTPVLGTPTSGNLANCTFPTLNQNTTGSSATVTGNATGSTFGFNSGYGSVATAYGCRAWVNFNGQSSAAIRGSGNISSITINATSDWTLNFTTAMPDANYAAVFGSDSIGNNDARGALVEKSNDGTSYHLAGSLRIIYGYTFTSGTTADGSFMSNVAIFR